MVVLLGIELDLVLKNRQAVSLVMKGVVVVVDVGMALINPFVDMARRVIGVVGLVENEIN